MANVLKMMMIEAIHSLRSAGLSCRDIGRRLGAHRETVSRHLRLGGEPVLKPASAPIFPAGSEAGVAGFGAPPGPGVAGFEPPTGSPRSQASVASPWLAWLLEQRERGLSAKRIHQDLLVEHPVCAHHSHPFPCRVTGEQSLAAATSATPFAGPGGPSSHRHGPPAPLRGTCVRPLDGPAARCRVAGPRSRSLRRGAGRAHP